MNLILPIGISGSGKTQILRKYYEHDDDWTIVCPDDIRKDLTGNISDQSKNKEVFDLVYFLIDACVKQNKNCFLDATNVNTYNRKMLVNKYKNNPNVIVQYDILPADVKLSYERIQNDLKNGVDRSNVPMEILEKQKKSYQKSLDSGFEGENVQSVIFVNDLNL